MTERQAAKRKNDLIKTRMAKEESLQRAVRDRERNMILKKELRAINREEREANVERMIRQQEYQKELVMKKIADQE